MNRCLAHLLILGLGLALATGTVPVARTAPIPKLGTAVIEFLDVGQGDAILIRSPEGKTALIDAGPSRDIVSLLSRRGIESLDLVVVSHHHADHYGGMEAAIRAFHPRIYLATGSSHTTPHYSRLLRTVRDAKMQAIEPTAKPRKIALGSIVLTVLPQPPEDRDNENNNSIGLRLQFGAFSALLTGDSESAERVYWERVSPELVRDCEVMKLSHHGSRDGTDTAWLELARPRLAVASLGRDNEFGHPNSETLGLLRQFRIPLMRTDRDGTVSVATDGERWNVSRVEGVGRPPTLAHEPRVRPPVEAKHGRKLDGPDHPIDINTASSSELDSLPGIGEVLARRIVEGRPYRSVDELARVKDIGEKKLERLRPFVRVR